MFVAWLMACVAAASATTAAAQPDKIAQGEKIATGGTPQGAAACVGCHGANGQGNADFPRLAGTGASYLQAQLDAFASGARKNSIMQQFAQKLTPDERSAVAAYYSQLPAPGAPKQTAQPPTPAELGGWLATRGRWSDQLPACAQCHGVDGSGVGAQFPPLAGLSENYIREQLTAWKANNRPPGPLGLMPAVASKLSDADVTAVAQYYAGLLADAPAPSAVPAAAKPAPRP
ncbi:MAG: c-type cytochrome [Gammaproteobacteria bacterium]|nr:c-type cytochrome [Gammaproteobacteria bacterium]MBU1443545.1 c-type cytochrome [Gammaproteobacteria bacterium]MBU2287846.1 c-type cytochrome [Gammaproteobacteria bacterium]MBU2410142.1 c-type cytochrome [Gammaproteobacteria bacterium]